MELKNWEELVGRLKGMKSNDDGTITLIVAVGGRIIEVKVPCGTTDFKQLIHSEIGVLRTDDPQRPFLLRKVTRAKNVKEG